MSAVHDFLNTKDAATLEQLRELLKLAGYLDSGIAPSLDPEWEPPLPEEAAPASPLNTLLRLFYMNIAVSMEEAAGALSPLSLEQLVKAGFIQRQDDRVSSTAFLQPYRDLLLAFPARDTDEDSVMPVSASSMELDHVTVRRPSRKTLDLGTGCGVQAMLAAKHSEQAYAVDLNPKAISFADFNCRWNGICNVTCLKGNLLEPVRDQCFDLIVCNPPYVISPAARLMYRDSGRDGEQFCIALARDAAQLLNADGYFQMIFQWIETAEQDWPQRLSPSFSGVGCDVWILRLGALSPDDYVRGWVHGDDEEAEALYQQWLQYLEGREAVAVATGFCTMRRVTGRPGFLWFDEAPEDRLQPYGDSISNVFAARQTIEGCSQPALLRHQLVASPHLRLVQVSHRQGKIWQPTASEFLLDEGLKYAFSDVDPMLASLATACDGERSLQEEFERLALENRVPSQGLISKYLPQVRELIRYGFLIPGSLQRARSDEPALGSCNSALGRGA